ncbi:MAG: DUF21 domain-containing protein, partial [Erysipelothrix sp.]|nr:DUF21 domain-containing protein [Erysipelothrix sp.]
MLTQIGLIFLLILLNAFFAGSEMAFISLNLNKMKQQDDKKSQKIVALASNSTKLLS